LLVVIDVQRGGPSTGCPTKTEQSDLFQALWGSTGESPIVVMAPNTPSDCFFTIYDASRVACKYMTPVIVLSDGYLANGSESWQIPDIESLPGFDIVTEKNIDSLQGFKPYKRFSKTLARPWIIPGTKGFEHRVGGLEKNEEGDVSSSGDNHQGMCLMRAKKISNVTKDIPFPDFYGNKDGEVLLLGWGSTFGSLRQATYNLIKKGLSVSHCHLTFLNPFFKDLKKILSSFKIILIAENNLGQLSIKIRSEFCVHTHSFNEVCGRPLIVSEIEAKVKSLL
jgi:2-oxoglutarate ferredoxin oxidoreductase subunit alpha